ncbi:hypothetical protein BU23DRAFT_663119 [Bimuria novae-zelandiae CBS 107.79]|uniref:WW domain-containing protein n=1 Tax=Bimuria novae-zelandiae CBS 107.79 TaxID=1447943 RepID=A0A6A5URK8_9PLEO|nr:hypothetical protein BU23DRAFT_663119 [Bimuria novae-zelandiae CBS 107.79]
MVQYQSDTLPFFPDPWFASVVTYASGIQITQCCVYSKCQDSRNIKIHMIVSLPSSALLIPPMWQKSTRLQSPYRENILSCLLRALRTIWELGFLVHCDLTTHGQMPDHPSWVPNWSTWRPIRLIPDAFALGRNGFRMRTLADARLIVPGVLCGVVEEVSDCAPMEGGLRATLRLWERTAKIATEKLSEEFIMALACGYYREDWPATLAPSLRQVSEPYHDENREPIVNETIRSRSIFICEISRVGICSSEAIAGERCWTGNVYILRLTRLSFTTTTPSRSPQAAIIAHFLTWSIGDILRVILGARDPLLLRPADCAQGAVTYQVVGPTYVSDLAHTEALLGPVPREYRAYICNDWEGIMIQGYTELKTGTRIYDDPRMGPLLDGWAFAKEYKPTEKELREFVNTKTGEKSWFDPRLSVPELRKGNVDIQEFVLV